ncbi:hypothetical protein [Oceanobacillus sp. CFH 90083]|uniref:hypothetical protein n=1 Tax=Oceanobacillus sp. CFH 90083 TaxID=2592336 RepID=UPI00128CEA0B|nr:hypothetical protein [Oceanobacillus sp. CFH 90083]
MYIFLAEYKGSITTISILSHDSKIIATRDVTISSTDYVQTLTKELIELSHEQELYHNDISGIGVVIDYSIINYTSEAALITDLESSFGFKSIVNSNRSTVVESLLHA